MTKNKFTHRGYEILVYSWKDEHEVFIINSNTGSIIITSKYNTKDIKEVVAESDRAIDNFIDELSDKDEYVYGQCKE